MSFFVEDGEEKVTVWQGCQTVEGSGFTRRRLHGGHKRLQLGQHLLGLVHVLLDDLHNRRAGNGTRSLRVNRRGDLIRREEIPKPCSGGAAWYSASFSTR